MASLLIRRARLLVTMDAKRREIPDGGVYAVGGVIEQVGRTDELPRSADRVIDAQGKLVMPGLINTHHHFFQTLTRALPRVQGARLFDWLKGLYPIWSGITPEMIVVSAKLAMAELVLSGCTTVCDHLYLFPPGVRLDDEIRAAQEMGVRLHACRGACLSGDPEGDCRPTRWWRTRNRS